MITAERKGYKITRNIALFKKVTKELGSSIHVNDRDEEDEIVDIHVPVPQEQNVGNPVQDAPQYPRARRNPVQNRIPPARYREDP